MRSKPTRYVVLDVKRTSLLVPGEGGEMVRSLLLTDEAYFSDLEQAVHAAKRWESEHDVEAVLFRSPFDDAMITSLVETYNTIHQLRRKRELSRLGLPSAYQMVLAQKVVDLRTVLYVVSLIDEEGKPCLVSLRNPQRTWEGVPLVVRQVEDPHRGEYHAKRNERYIFSHAQELRGYVVSAGIAPAERVRALLLSEYVRRGHYSPEDVA